MKQVLMFVGGFSVKVSRDIAVIEKNVDIKKGYRCECTKQCSTYEQTNYKPTHGVYQTVLDTRANILAISRHTASAKQCSTHEQIF